MGSTPSGISGSRAASILGLSEYQTPVETWQRIMEERRPGFNAGRGYTLPESPDNAPIRWGNAFEDSIVRLAEEARGQTIGCREQMYARSPEGQLHASSIGAPPPPQCYMTCHIDGLYADGVLHEGKTAGYFAFADSWGDPGTDRIPQGYQIQVQHNLMLTGAQHATLTVLVWPRRPDEWEAAGITLERHPGRSDDLEWYVRMPDRETKPGRFVPCSSWAKALGEMGYLHQYEVDARPSLQAELVRLYTEWWQTHVIGEREPEPRTYDDLRRLVPAPKGTVVADEQAQRWAVEYREIGDEIGSSGRLSKRRDELKVLLLSWMRGQDAAMDDESREKTVLRDARGQKLAQWNGKVFRT